MADSTLSTRYSRPAMPRRSVLAGGASALAGGALATPPAWALSPPAGPGRDSEILRWVAAAERYWAAFVAENAACERLHTEVGRHPDAPYPMVDSPEARALWDAVAARLGLPEADARCARLHMLYRDAARTAFDIPARALPGLHAKMHLGVTVAREHRTRDSVPVDLGFLDVVLAELRRIAAG